MIDKSTELELLDRVSLLKRWKVDGSAGTKFRVKTKASKTIVRDESQFKKKLKYLIHRLPVLNGM
jgi:hypothetical protein